ncbi:MAG: hypothetical protein MJ252_17855 [archaeon]|nr:hypothetical protein [archaeon]
MFDLLAPNQTFEQKEDITFQEDARGNVIIKGLSKHPVANEEEAFNFLFEGESNRTISEHKLNKESTRSHCVFTISLEMKSKIESNEKVITSKLNFVDLAGSERVKKTGSTGLALKEATYINKSLTFLEQVVVALTDKKKKEYVPYRQSKLTHILKDSIGGNCKTVMIANIWPEEPYINETLSTLNFAKRMKNVVNEITVNVRLDTQALLRKLTKEVKELKQELAMHNTLTTGRQINYDPYTEEEQYEQQQIAMKFLFGKEEDINFESVRQAKELFNQCRKIYQKHCVPGAISEEEKVKQMERQKSLKEEKGEAENKDMVGEVEEKPSFGIGRAPKNARPISKFEQTGNNLGVSANLNPVEEEEEDKKLEEAEKEMKEREIEIEEDYDLYDPNEPIPNKDQAFAMFKSRVPQAKEIEEEIRKVTKNIKDKKEEALKQSDKGKILKQEIEELKKKLEEKKKNKQNLADANTNVIDEEECRFIADLKEKKKALSEDIRAFKDCQSEINEMKTNLDRLKVAYVDSFEKWFKKKYRISLEEHELKEAKRKHKVEVDSEIRRDIPKESDEIAYLNAKKKVQSIHNAKRMEKKIK